MWSEKRVQYYAALDLPLVADVGDTRLPAAVRRRQALAALIAIGCNIGPQRMGVASGLDAHEITFVADWQHLTEEALKSATIEIINFAS